MSTDRSNADFKFRTRSVEIEDAAIQLVDDGDGPPIVFSHGTPTFSYEFRHLIRELKTNQRCLAPDHLGFGSSSRPASADYTPEAHARRFAKLMDELKLPRLTLVVHDFGGPIALEWALKNPQKLERLIVINSWMWPFSDDPVMARRARMIDGKLGRFLYRRLNASLKLIMPSAYGDKSKLTKDIHRVYLEKFPDADSRERVLFALAKSLLGSSAYYKKLWDSRLALLNVPMEIIWGMKDTAFGPDQLEKWKAAFPKARIFEIKDSGHWPHEENPGEVLKAMRTLGL